MVGLGGAGRGAMGRGAGVTKGARQDKSNERSPAHRSHTAQQHIGTVNVCALRIPRALPRGARGLTPGVTSRARRPTPANTHTQIPTPAIPHAQESHSGNLGGWLSSLGMITPFLLCSMLVFCFAPNKLILSENESQTTSTRVQIPLCIFPFSYPIT